MKRQHNIEHNIEISDVKRRKKRVTFADEVPSATATILATTLRNAILNTIDGRLEPLTDAIILEQSFKTALANILIPMITRNDEGPNTSLQEFVTTLLQRSYRYLEKIRLSNTGNNVYEIAAALRDSCGGAIRASSLLISPIIKYVDTHGQKNTAAGFVTECRLGWLTNTAEDEDRHLLWRRTDQPAVTVACNMSTSMPSGAALVTDALLQSVRLNELRDVVQNNNTRHIESAFSPLRTQLYCKYDIMTCATLHLLGGVEKKFRHAFARELDVALRQAHDIEATARTSLATAQNRFSVLKETIRTEKDALIIARTNERTLLDQSTALHVLLANLEKDLRNRAAIELQKTQEEIATRLEHKFSVWQNDLNELMRQYDILIGRATCSTGV